MIKIANQCRERQLAKSPTKRSKPGMGWEHSQEYSLEFSIEEATHGISLTCGILCALRTLVLLAPQTRGGQYFNLDVLNICNYYIFLTLLSTQFRCQKSKQNQDPTALKYWFLSCLCLQPTTLVSTYYRHFATVMSE